MIGVAKRKGVCGQEAHWHPYDQPYHNEIGIVEANSLERSHKQNVSLLLFFILNSLVFKNNFLTKVIFKSMQTFAVDTRQRLHLVETQEDANSITRKFLSTQLSNLVPVSKLYPFVGDDYDAVQFRAPGSLDTYAKYKHVPPAELDRLVTNEHNYKYARDHVPAFEDFVETVKPPKDKEVYAFFVHGQIQKNLSDHVNYMTEDFHERQRLYNAIRDYKTPMSAELVQTVGKFLQELQVGPAMIVAEEVDKPQKPQIKEEEEEEETLTTRGVEIDSSHQQADDLWENPILKAFKVEAGLASQFCDVKASKQALVSMFAPLETHMLAKLMGRYQSDVPRVAPEAQEWKPLVTAYSPAQLKAITQTEQAQQFYRRQPDKPVTNLEWVQRLLEARQPLTAEVLKILTE